MRALIFDGPMQIHVANIERPVPDSGEVAVRVRSVGICGSDVHGFTGRSGRRVPGMVMGHELAGEIVEVGPGVAQALIGGRVAVNPTIGCGHCSACAAGETNLCPRRRTIGVNMGTKGGFAEFVTVPAENCVTLADNVSYGAAALAEPLAVGLHAAVLAGASPGLRILVIGGGTIGLCILLAARRLGAEVFLAETMESRLRFASSLGAVPLEPPGAPIAETVRRLAPDGLDAAVDAVGTGETLSQALEAIKYAGQVVWVGNIAPAVELPANPIMGAERVLRGCYAYTAPQYRQAIDLINTGAVDVSPLVGDVVGLSEAPLAFSSLASGENRSIKVVVQP